MEPRRAAPYGRRFLAAYGLLTILLAVAAGAGFRTHMAAADRTQRCVPLAAADDPILTAITFIRTAVERLDPDASYGLVTPALRAGLSCREWASGKLPVERYAHVDWNRASYKMMAGGTGQLVLDVTLVSTERAQPPGRFVLELRQDGPRWFVGFWQRAESA